MKIEKDVKIDTKVKGRQRVRKQYHYVDPKLEFTLLPITKNLRPPAIWSLRGMDDHPNMAVAKVDD